MLAELGDGERWVEFRVTADKLHCVCDASEPGPIEEHARRGGFPCDRISAVRGVISPEVGS